MSVGLILIIYLFLRWHQLIKVAVFAGSKDMQNIYVLEIVVNELSFPIFSCYDL